MIALIIGWYTVTFIFYLLAEINMEIYKIMADLVQQGVSIIMVSSELPELISVADNILVMREGVMKGVLSKGEINQERIMSFATAE